MVVVAVATFNFVLSDNGQNASELTVQNIEALASADDFLEDKGSRTVGSGSCNTWVSSPDGSYYKACKGYPINCVGSTGTCTWDCSPHESCWNF